MSDQSLYIPEKTIEVNYTSFQTKKPQDLQPFETEKDLPLGYKKYEGEVKIYNQFGDICIRVFKKKFDSQVNHNAVSAIETLFRNLETKRGDDSFHHGPWRGVEKFSFTSTELQDAINFYEGVKYPAIWRNRAFQAICKVVDGRFGAMRPKVAEQYKEVDAARYYTKSFTMCVINKGGTTPHYDYKDEPEGYCCVVPLGNFTGGDLIFREHKIQLALQPGDLVFFHSRNLLHENLAFTGSRYSLVFTTHHSMFTEFGQSVLEERTKTYKMYIQHPLKARQYLELLSDEEVAAEQKKVQEKYKCETKYNRAIAVECRKSIAEKNLLKNTQQNNTTKDNRRRARPSTDLH